MSRVTTYLLHVLESSGVLWLHMHKAKEAVKEVLPFQARVGRQSRHTSQLE